VCVCVCMSVRVSFSSKQWHSPPPRAGFTAEQLDYLLRSAPEVVCRSTLITTGRTLAQLRAMRIPGDAAQQMWVRHLLFGCTASQGFRLTSSRARAWPWWVLLKTV